MDKAIKRYLYVRDKGKCHHCSKSLKMNQVSIDHYVPRSKEGKDEIYNFVLSCKRCNKFKGVRVPEDYEVVHLRNFIQGVRDRVITASIKGLKEKDLMEGVAGVKRVIYRERETIFFSDRAGFHLVDNRIKKIEGGI